MSVDSEPATQVVNGDVDDDRSVLLIEEPCTPQDNEPATIPSSQDSLPPTEAPGSPIDPSASFRTEPNDDRFGPGVIIPSSLTPPPSSQVPTNAAGHHGLGYVGSQQTGIFSPPATTLNNIKREPSVGSEYTAPTPQEVVEASPDELRGMLQSCIMEHAKLKMEAAHHKLQYSLLNLQADEDSKRALVEHEMIRREVEALRTAEHSRQARSELTGGNNSNTMNQNTAFESATYAKYEQMKIWYEQSVDEVESLNKRLKLAKKLIQQKEDENISLTDERDLLLNRIRENREHFHILCSPGGMFHGAAKNQNLASPVQQRSTPKQTPKSARLDSGSRIDRDHRPENIAMLLQVLSQDGNSAPSTPTAGHRPGPRASAKHTRNAQSMSSLPTTPITRRNDYGSGGLLPSVDLVPQSEPPYRHPNRHVHEPRGRRSSHDDHHHERRQSRESTISAEDNEELARQALQSVAAASFASVSRASHISSHRSSHRSVNRDDEQEEEEEEVYESQASQAASEMLRRDPRQSFDVASSVGGSRDGTPAAEKSGKLQAKLIGGLHKSGILPPASGTEKRKFSGGSGERREDSLRDMLASPTKKLRTVGGLRDVGGPRVGLGIQYGK
jgi:acetyl-CoA acyltransferase 1